MFLSTFTNLFDETEAWFPSFFDVTFSKKSFKKEFHSGKLVIPELKTSQPSHSWCHTEHWKTTRMPRDAPRMLYAMNIQLYQILSGYAVSEHQLLQSHFKVEATCASASLCSNTAETRHHKMITYINISTYINHTRRGYLCTRTGMFT